MLRGTSNKGHMPREGEGAVVRQGRLIAVVRASLIGCAFLLLVVGCSGTRSEAPKEKEKGRTEATKEQRHTEATTTAREHTEATTTEQERTPEATESEEARCEGTRTYHSYFVISTETLMNG